MNYSLFAYCGNQPGKYIDTSGYGPKINKADLIAQGGVAALEFALINMTINASKNAAQSISRFVANTKEDLKRLSKTLVDAAKKRWDDSQPCIHHVVPQGCSCESAKKARSLINGKVESVNNQVIINYETHRAIHANEHAYCDSVYEVLSACGEDKGMRILKMGILWDATARGGYFYGWI